MENIFKLVKKDNNVIVTFANYAYKEVALNWVTALRRLQLRNYVIIALDNDIYNYLVSQKINTILREFDGNLSDLWIFRIKVLQEMLNFGVDIIHSDSDAIWLKNPIPEYFINNDSDMIFSQGTVYPRDVKDRWGFVVCCGLFMMKSNDRVKSIMSEINDTMKTIKDDQVAVNYYLDKTLKMNWIIKNAYKLPVFDTDFMCSRDVMVGISSKMKQMPDTTQTNYIKISVLPHHLFQRLHVPEEPVVYVKHILSQKNYASKLDMFKQTDCLFI